MDNHTEDSKLVEILYEAESNADEYRERLLESNIENDQLYDNYCKVYDILCKISARIEMIDMGFSSPEIVIREIETLIEE